MSDTQTIKDRIDIVQFIEEYIPLKKAGSSWKANCPFHNEKTPSFMVQRERQTWHCFGCGKGGDIFSFIQEIEGIDFLEALKILAERAGVQLKFTQQNEVLKSQKNRVLEINSLAANFFFKILTEISAGKSALDYLTKKRELTNQTIKDWSIGYIPDQWELLTQYMVKKGKKIDDLVASGLVIKSDKKNNSYYDRFRGRIMFPIFDIYNNVVGFTGRLLYEKEGLGGKYVNTPQSITYDKSKILYGLNFAKQAIKKEDLVVLVEGQMDVIACHSIEMKNVIAISGTALTIEQIHLIKRFTNNIAIAFDSDSAGINAVKRATDLAITQGVNIKIISIPEGAGEDVDECIKKNKNVWLKAVTEAVGIMEWYFKNVLKEIDLNSPHNKQKVADILLTEIKKIPFAVERDGWIKKLAEILSVEYAVLIEIMNNIKISKESNNLNTEERKEKVKNNYLNLVSIKKDILLEKILTLIVSDLQIYELLKDKLKKEYFINSEFGTLYDCLEKYYNNTKQKNTKELLETDNKQLVLLQMRAEKDYTDWILENKIKEAQIILLEIEKEYKKQLRNDLKKQLLEAQKKNDNKLEDEILKKIMELT